MTAVVTAIVLAAGRGSRLGGPKALLKWPRSRQDARSGSWQRLGDEQLAPLALVHALTRLRHDCDRALVVTRAEIAAKLTAWLAAHPLAAAEKLHLVRSTAPEELKAAGSLAAAAAALSAEQPPDGLFVITPVDCPPADAGVVSSLRQCLQRRADLVAARPRVGHRCGHPVLLRAVLFARYAAPDPPPLRELLRSYAPQVADVELDDPTVLLNLNTAADISRYSGGSPPQLY